MKKTLALVVAAAMGLSSVAFAAEITPAPTANAAATSAPAKATSYKTVHHKKHRATQKAQSAKKHHKSPTKPAAQKAQSAKKHHKKAVTPAA